MRRALRGILAAIALAGCSTAPPRVGEQPPRVSDPVAEEQYHDVYSRWTRGTEVYDVFDARLFLAATEESPEFVSARAARLANFEGMPENVAQDLTRKELADASQGYAFFVGLHTGDPRINDLDRVQSIWRIALQTSAGEVTPASIERVSRLNSNLRGLYFFLGDFWVGYRIRFPATLPGGVPLVAPGEKDVTLKLDSSVGHAKLTFPAVSMATAPAAAPVAQ